MPTLDHPVFALSDQLVRQIAHHRPSTASMWGFSEHDHDWDDLSPDGVAAWRSFLVDAQRQLKVLPAATERWDTLAVHVAVRWAEQALNEVDSGAPFRALAHINSPFENLYLTLTHMDRSTPAGVEAIRSRLAGLPAVLQGYRQALAHGLSIGERASARQVRSCIHQGHTLIKNRSLSLLDGPEAERATAAYASLTCWLESTYLPAAEPKDGIGEARYLPAAQSSLHHDIDLDSTYAWGWTTVQALHADLLDVLSRVAPGLSIAQAVEAWRVDPQATAPSPDAFLAQVQAWQDDALTRLEPILPVPPVARNLVIERAPRGLPPGAWYLSPSEDGVRPGKVQYSLRDGLVPLFDQQSTACHEGFPGHHLQLAIQTTLTDRLSRLHRLAFACTGFSEGWALYAERLVDEQGGYESELQRAGYLVNQLARACRVVLDIGLHTGRPLPSNIHLPTDEATGVCPGADWNYDRAVAFMTGIGGLRREVSESEITRYLGWPGQAISYSVGMKRLLELREQFLGQGGSLLAFHERVLGSGTVGLSQVAKQVLR